jgi:uncharacterized phage-associated protein
MSYSPRIVANALIRKGKEHGEKLTHMKLQKLVFFLHGWGLALQGRPIISEQVEAWPYGPVVDALYHELKHHGSRPIEQYLVELDEESGQLKAFVPTLKDQRFWDLLEKVWDRYGSKSAIFLSEITHLPGTPWEQTRKSGGRMIPDELIASYFKGKLQQHAG